MLSNPYVRALVGGLAAALAVAGPLVDNGLAPSEVVAVALAFLSGSGLTAVAPSGKASDEDPTL
jgi:hypothetical protein